MFIKDQIEAKNPRYTTAGGNAAFHNYINDVADVDDPLEKRRLALERIDNRSFGWQEIRMIIIAGAGNLTDAYDIFAINLAISIMSYVFWQGSMPSSTETLLKVSTSVGTVIGQIGFGSLGDILGRKTIYGLELIIMILCSILQCTVGSSPGVSFVAVLTFYRIVMGIGIGGDYPLSSIISSEFSTTKWRGAIMSAVGSNQALGQITGGIVAIIIIASYKDDLIGMNNGSECDTACRMACDKMWRLLIGFGAVPGLSCLYYRLTIPESPRYFLDVNMEFTPAATISEKNIASLQVNSSLDICSSDTHTLRAHYGSLQLSNKRDVSFKNFCKHFGQWKYGKILLGTAGSWFAVDVAFYGLSLNSAVILQTIGYAGSSNVYKKLYNSAAGNLILICAGALPGFWFSIATIDIIGRKTIQMMGFVVLTILFCIIGFAYHKIGDHGLLGLYILCQFFSNFGPNTTVGIVPGESFPTRYRSTAHGISAASGKIGAILAQTALGTLINHNCDIKGKAKGCWLPHVMQIFALFMLLGCFTTLLIPETKRMTLEEISVKYHDELNQCAVSNVSISDEQD